MFYFANVNLDILEYNLDLDASLFAVSNSTMSSPSNIPPPSTGTCAAYIEVLTKTKAISEKTIKKEEKTIL